LPPFHLWPEEISVLLVELMAPMTMGLGEMDCWDGLTTKGVLLGGDDLHVTRVDAVMHPTEVVDAQVVGYRCFHQFIDKPMYQPVAILPFGTTIPTHIPKALP
jgi:hypothetical protein